MGGEGDREEAEPFRFSSFSLFFSASLSSLSLLLSWSRDLSLLLSLPRERDRCRLRESDLRPLLRDRERREEYALGGVRDRRFGGERVRDRRFGDLVLDLLDLDGRSFAGITTMPDLDRDRRRRGERVLDLREVRRGDLDLLPRERDLRRRPLERDLDLLDRDLERLYRDRERDLLRERDRDLLFSPAAAEIRDWASFTFFMASSISRRDAS